MKQSYKQKPRKRRTLPCRCSLVGRKLFFKQNRRNALDKISEIFVNYKVTFLIYKKLLFFHFYPTDLVYTKTTIPLRSVNSATYSPPRFASRYIFSPLFNSPSGIVVYYRANCAGKSLLVAFTNTTKVSVEL